MSDYVVFLPGAREPQGRWLRVEAGAVAGRGEGIPDPGEAPVVAVAPAEDIALHWAEISARSPAQAAAAARLLVADAVISPAADVHVAVGDAEGADRPIAVVARARIDAWLAALAARGVDPWAIIPEPLLLPRPGDGFVRADLGAGHVVRGATCGFVDEPGLTALITAGEVPVALDREAIETSVAQAVAAPPLNLRQGAYARRDEWMFDWRRLRRAGYLAAAVVLVTVSATVAQIARYSFAADAAEARADAVARQGLAHGETVNDAERQIVARLARLRGPGEGFSATAAAVFDAVRAVPGSELHALSFDPAGALHTTLVTENEGEVTDVRNHVAATGMNASVSTIVNNGGKYSCELTVMPR